MNSHCLHNLPHPSTSEGRWVPTPFSIREKSVFVGWVSGAARNPPSAASGGLRPDGLTHPTNTAAGGRSDFPSPTGRRRSEGPGEGEGFVAMFILSGAL